MGLLDKLWDDVVAGPKPSEGLGKLRRKINQISEDQSKNNTELHQFERDRKVSKSIPVPKRPGNLKLDTSDSNSTSSPSTPSSPLLSPSMISPASRIRHSLFRECNSSFTTQSDLVVISALDK